jgi:predicted O-methyltransferase YrrM
MRQIDFDILKFMAKKFNPLPTGYIFLDTRYNWQKHTNGAEWPYYRFFYYLSQMLQPALVLELGGFQGTAAAHFAAGYEKTNVITVDHHSDPGDEANQERMLEAQKEFPSIVYLQGWTTARAAAKNKGLHTLGDMGDVYQRVVDHTLYYGRGIDILFIDSWHHYEYARGDWEVYKPLLNSPALVICDDIIDGDDSQAPIYGMIQFWDEMPEPKFLNSNLHPGSNMGFVYLLLNFLL